MDQQNHSQTPWTLAVAVTVLSGIQSVQADFYFGRPVNLGPTVNGAGCELGPCLSADGLSLFLASDRGGGSGRFDLWLTTRATTSDSWGKPRNLGASVNSPSEEYQPTISPDGLELYFASLRGGGVGGADLWMTKRATASTPWTKAVNLGLVINTPDHETFPRLSADGLELYFTSGQAGTTPQLTFHVARRAARDAPWTAPVSLGAPPNRWRSQFDPAFSSDGLLMMFSDYMDAAGPASRELWFCRRTAVNAPWGLPVHAGAVVNSTAAEGEPMLSADGSMLYFSSNRTGANYMNLWQAALVPKVDLDDDGQVGAGDREILMKAWGTSEALCDIGPMPWGDGVVDNIDLDILMGAWGQKAPDPNAPVAHWKLDESEGTIAHDSSGTYDASLCDNPVWQPGAGKVDGALLLDGQGDAIETGFILNPADSSFSIFAWVKGGAPIQVIFSQSDGRAWLAAAATAGYLETDLHSTRPIGHSLSSQTPVTDGEWHHVGLVWGVDRQIRTLYVDHAEAARDPYPQTFLDITLQTDGGLHIGAPSRLNFPGFWSGLIDDVRIYDRAVKP